MPQYKRIILLGPPASGKGTQAKKLAEAAELPVLGTGNILRQAVADGTDLGLQVESFLSKGLYVPDHLIETLVELWVSEHAAGWIFDGFPRTATQANFIEENSAISSPDLVIGFQVPVDDLKNRINSRRQCRKCDLVTSTFVHKGSVCPSESCDGELYARNDDAIESFRVRYQQYTELTEPLFNHYCEKGLLVEVDGAQAPEKVFDAVYRAVFGSHAD